MNDVTYSWNYVTVFRFKDCIFVNGIVTGSVFIKYKISNS